MNDTHTAMPEPRVDSIRITGPGRPKPEAGDRRVTKTRGLQVRVQCMARDLQGRPIGRLVNNGKPCFDWRTLIELDPWDHHLLTSDDLAVIAEFYASPKP